ncbi:hypothetical protein, partial [Paraburkholderia metrosideri]|uniref:hypothetical protein n=1 Tax=Paraburkholderia metrosideri TaxID=580937 RepID=UPI001F2AC7CB
ARVKVGNRQAPQHVQKPHPNKVGFLRFWPSHRSMWSPLVSTIRSKPMSKPCAYNALAVMRCTPRRQAEGVSFLRVNR